MAQGATLGARPVRAKREVAGIPTRTLVSHLGFWSGLLTAVCSAGFLVLNLAIPSPPWHGMPAYIAAFDQTQMLWMIPTLLLAPTFVVLMACVKAGAAPGRQVVAEVAVLFAVLYAALAMTNYFIQLASVRASILGRTAQDLGFLAMTNPAGLFISLEGLGYLLQQIGMLFVSFVFVGGRLQRSIRWSLFGASFGCWLIAAILIVVLPSTVLNWLGGNGLVSVGTDLWAVFLALAAALLALWFRRQTSAGDPG
jgi:hypothetical protein